MGPIHFTFGWGRMGRAHFLIGHEILKWNQPMTACPLISFFYFFFLFFSSPYLLRANCHSEFTRNRTLARPQNARSPRPCALALAPSPPVRLCRDPQWSPPQQPATEPSPATTVESSRSDRSLTPGHDGALACDLIRDWCSSSPFFRTSVHLVPPGASPSVKFLGMESSCISRE